MLYGASGSRIFTPSFPRFTLAGRPPAVSADLGGSDARRLARTVRGPERRSRRSSGLPLGARGRFAVGSVVRAGARADRVVRRPDRAREPDSGWPPRVARVEPRARGRVPRDGSASGPRARRSSRAMAAPSFAPPGARGPQAPPRELTRVFNQWRWRPHVPSYGVLEPRGELPIELVDVVAVGAGFVFHHSAASPSPFRAPLVDRSPAPRWSARAAMASSVRRAASSGMRSSSVSSTAAARALGRGGSPTAA